MSERADHLGVVLGGLTAPVQDAGVWRGALERARERPVAKPAKGRPRFTLLEGLVVVVIVAGLIGILLPSLGRARAFSPEAMRAARERAEGASSFGGGAQSPFNGDTEAGDALVLGSRISRDEMSPLRVPEGEPEGAVARHVVRKATVEVVVEDVRAAFVRAQQFVSAARGEYVQDSQSRDRGGGVLEADLVLRVEARRMGEVLNAVRGLGEVRHERSDADDVTGRVVDLEARLRAQRVVEEELLRLLRERADADLEDIVRVRRELALVRETIERLEGERAQIRALARLATVAVVLRQVAEAEPEEEVEGLGAWFGRRIGAAWDGGVRTLLGTVAGIVRVAVGGLVWWVIAGVAGVIAWRGWRRGHAGSLPERA